jgi:hypothetical protein
MARRLRLLRWSEQVFLAFASACLLVPPGLSLHATLAPEDLGFAAALGRSLPVTFLGALLLLVLGLFVLEPPAKWSLRPYVAQVRARVARVLAVDETAVTGNEEREP